MPNFDPRDTHSRYVLNVRATNERLVFEVESEHRPGKLYRVDMAANGGGGRCSCRDHATRRQVAIDAGALLLTNLSLCKHVEAVCWHMLRQTLPTMAAAENVDPSSP